MADLGLGSEAKTKAAEALRQVLADTYMVYMKTHGYHWNVTGPQFHALHTMFEEQYTEMWNAMDDIAERIRALGAFAPGTGREMAELSAIEEADNTVPSAANMVANLLADHEKLIRRTREAVEVADEVDDDGTEDMLIARMQQHEKFAWMLRATAGE